MKAMMVEYYDPLLPVFFSLKVIDRKFEEILLTPFGLRSKHGAACLTTAYVNIDNTAKEAIRASFRIN